MYLVGMESNRDCNRTMEEAVHFAIILRPTLCKQECGEQRGRDRAAREAVPHDLFLPSSEREIEANLHSSTTYMWQHGYMYEIRSEKVRMETIAKAYEVKFVLDVAQLGEDDPLWQNEPLHDGKISTSYRGQTKWLDQSLALTDSSWKIVVGYDPLLVCNGEETPETTKFYVPFQHIFAKYEVNAYISMAGFCGYFHRDNSILYIGHPSPGGDHKSVDGFFLHRVRPLELEMESMLINVEGRLVQRSVVQQHGTGAM
ncbi:unnamed protein product [Miscanthus lutarioriparius]|uniref:Uncharacterized protein n=1 Tax=Miscanthus lutarioriparius TaxID=422564 RepID=A0A811S7Y9_9POAL|nr:unnamed protein product [Miscanthus lutarioriparius]